MQILIFLLIYIIKITISIIETTIMYKLFNSFLTIKTSKIVSLLAFTLLFITCMLPIQSGDMDNIIYAFITFLVVGIISFKDIIIKRICAVFMLCTILLSTKMISARICYLFVIQNYDFYFIVQSLIRNFIIFLIYLLLHKAVIWTREIFSNKIWIYLCIISLSAFTAIVISIIPFIYRTTLHDNLIIIIIMTLYILGTIATFYVIKEIAQGEKSKSLNSQLLIEMQHYTDMEENQNITKKVLHDMTNHLGVINSFLYDDDMVGAQAYLDNVSEIINSLGPKTFCENKVVNSILNNKYNYFTNLNIKTNIDVYIPNYINISQIDLCSIFSNTIDNAVEACRKIQDQNKRYINIKSKVDKGFLVYSIENSKENCLEVNGNKFITDKKEFFMHGYGLDIIRNIVDKYNGTIEIEYEENKFLVFIIIKN